KLSPFALETQSPYALSELDAYIEVGHPPIMGVGYWPQNRLSPTKAQRMILLWPWVWIITLLICLGGAENRARMLGWMIVGAVATPLVVWFWVSVLGMTPLNMALPARFSRFILVILGGNPVS